MIETILTKSFEIVRNIIACMWLEYLKTLARICIVPSYKHSLVSLILHDAILLNKKNAAEFALKNGAHPNAGNMQDVIFHNRYDILKLLLKNGLNPNLDLNLAIWFRSVEMTELLLQNVADVHISIFQRGAIEKARGRDIDARLTTQPKMEKFLLEIDAIWKKATQQRLSDKEAELFLSSKPELAKDFLNARAIKVIDKIKQRDKLTGPEIKFFNNPEYKHLQAFQELDVLLLKNAELSRHSISSKLNRDVTKYILDFFPKHEELKLQTLLTPYGLKHSLKKQYIAGKEEYPLSSKNLDKIISETADEEYFNSPQGQYLSGMFAGIFIFNPAIRYLRDKVNIENENKFLIQYYSEILGKDHLINLANGIAIPLVTQIVSNYFGIPAHIINGNQHTSLASLITDSPITQGLIESTIIEVAMLAGDFYNSLES